MSKIIITRPLKDARPLAQRLTGAGFDPVVAPLMEIIAKPDAMWPNMDYQAVLFTSANGAEALGAHSQGELLQSLPAFAVGPASQAAAVAAGFAGCQRANGDVASLIEKVKAQLDPASGPLLYISGDHIASDLQSELAHNGFRVERAILYQACAADKLPPEAAAALNGPAPVTVLLYSPRSARIWVDLIAGAGLNKAAGDATYLCLSGNVAKVMCEALPQANIDVPDHPDEDAVMRLLTPAN